jgi:hypothetical protein
MSTLGRFLSKSRFKLNFISLHSHYMSAHSTLRANKSADLCLIKIVTASNWKELDSINQSDVIASDRRECGNFNLLFEIKFPLSLLSSQRCLQQPRLVNIPGESIIMTLMIKQVQ